MLPLRANIFKEIFYFSLKINAPQNMLVSYIGFIPSLIQEIVGAYCFLLAMKRQSIKITIMLLGYSVNQDLSSLTLHSLIFVVRTY